MNKHYILYVFLFLISSCCFRSPQPTYYSLSTINNESISHKKLSIAINKVILPSVLERPQIVLYDSSNQVTILEFDRWDNLFSNVIQTSIINNLNNDLPNAYIKSSYFEAPNVQYNVVIDITQFQTYINEKIELSASWKIINAKGNIIANNKTTLTIKINGKNITDAVKSQSIAIAKLANLVALDLAKL